MRWDTFWGRHVERSQMPPILAGCVLVLCILPSLLGMTGHLAGSLGLQDWPSDAAARNLAHLAFDGSAALLAVVVTVLALVRLDASPLSVTLATSLPFVALLDLIHLSTGRLGKTATPELFAWTWTVSRTFFALVLVVSIALTLFRHARHRDTPKGFQTCNVLLGGLALLLALFGGDVPGLRVPVRWDPLIPRPGELPALALWLVLFSFLLPKLHRREPSVLSHALFISAIPQIGSQIEMAFGSTRAWDVHFVVGHWQKLLAYGCLFGGVVLDALYDSYRRESVITEFESMQEELERQTSELEILDERRIRELAASEAKFQSILDNASDLVQTVDSEGRFLYVNPAWRKTLGYSPRRVEEITWWDILHPDDHLAFRGLFSRALSGETFPGIEAVFLSRDGRAISVEGNITVLATPEEPLAVQGIFRDITERKETEAMKEAFISTVSHELRTPLTSIYGSLCLLESGDVPAEQQHEFLTVAIRNCDRLLRLINDLLDLQRLAAGKTEFKIEPVEVRPILEQEVASMQSYAHDKGIEVVLGEVPTPCSCLADRERLAQVLDNLLSNAIKFSPEGKQVVLMAQDLYDRTRISVIDQGPGIPEDFQHRLFDEFTQLDPSATRRTGGSGLGLSIARGMTERMGGSLSFETSPQQGTTFHLDFLSSDD